MVGVVAQTRPPKFTRINQVLVTHDKTSEVQVEEQDGRWETARDSFTYSPGNWVQRENSENSKHSSLLLEHTTSRDFRLSLRCCGSMETKRGSVVNVNKVKNRRINFVCTSSASGKKDWLLARPIFTLRTDEREREKRERGQRERPRVYRRYQRY